MQSRSPTATAPSILPAATSFSMSVGTSRMGQVSTHRPQRRHGSGARSSNSPSANRSTPDIPFTTGTSSVPCAMPIIGPPATTFTTSRFVPPDCSTSAETSVPMRAR